ncbi:MAG: CHRD domain-containing protein [Pseudonocardiaceae bacterium]
MIQLADMPTGAATVSWNPTTKLITVAVHMYGFTPSSSHAMDLHPGTCGAQPQPRSVPFPDISADAGGAVNQSVVSDPVPDGIPTASSVNIHLAPSAQLGTPTEVSFTPIACADIPAATPPTGPVTLQLHPPPQQGQTPTGTATLTYTSTTHTVHVEIKARGLPPKSAHAAHIHAGSCRTQGAVLYPLPDLQANASGEASMTTTVTNVTAPPPTGWYVNVHMGPMNQILNGNSPTLLFAPILCGDVSG